MKNLIKLKLLKLLLILVVLIYVVHLMVQQKVSLRKTYILQINHGDLGKLVLNKLYQQRILSRNNYYFLIAYTKFTKVDRKFKAGEYNLEPGLRVLSLVKKLVYGQVLLHKFTIIEGSRFTQTITALQQNTNITHTLINADCKQVLAAIGRPSNIYELGCEGLFMPDTYLFTKNTKDVVILQQAYDAMQHKLNDLWQNSVKGQLKSSYDALIMASIIEKETSLVSEMRRISAVYHKRLKIGWPLQADPTVVYGLGIHDRLLTRKDLKKPSLYNTYLHKGLPPTPIAAPSKAAIWAALNPDELNYLYFVADGSGGHIFSNSLAEHNSAILKIKSSKLNVVELDSSV